MAIPKVKRYENGKEIVGQVDTPYEITWEVWQLLTDAEKEKRKWLITDVPSADGFITVENMKLLWSNPSPNASFAGQNITLASADYDLLLAIYTANKIGDRNLSTIWQKGKTSVLEEAYSASNGSINRIRYLTYVSDTVYAVDNGYESTSSTRTQDNTACVPLVIYGFKKQTEIRFNALAENVKATVDYSTDEHPIGTWIDGSTLYEKTVDLGTLPNATNKAVAHGISNLYCVISIEGVAVDPTSSKTFKNLPFPVASGTGAISYYIDDTYVRITTSNDQRGYNGYATLRYTKTA